MTYKKDIRPNSIKRFTKEKIAWPIFKLFFKFLIYSILIFTIVIVGFFGYQKLYVMGVFMSKEEKYFYQKLKEFKESGKEKIALRELTNFEWDEICYIGPYSGIDLNGTTLSKKMIDVGDDNRAAIIFVKKKTNYGIVLDASISLLYHNIINSDTKCFVGDLSYLYKSNKQFFLRGK